MRSATMRTVSSALVATWMMAAAPLVGVAAESGGKPAVDRAPEAKLVGVVNLNTATPEELELLPGIGPAKALAIVEDRKSNGAYQKVEDLMRVPGIGERGFELIRPHLAVQGNTTARASE